MTGLNFNVASRCMTLLIIMTLPFSTWAQTDTAQYMVTMNDGSQFRCKILEVKKGEYLKLIKQDSAVVAIDWALFKDYQTTYQTDKLNRQKELLQQKKAEEKETARKQHEREAALKRVAKLTEKHATWIKCFVVMLNGDTVNGKIQNRPANEIVTANVSHGKLTYDYSLQPEFFTEGNIFVAKDNEEEETIKSSNFRTLYIPQEDSDFRKYITVSAVPANPGKRKICRVLIDGECSLLYDGSTTTQGGSTKLYEDPVGGATGIAHTVSNRYYLYYQNNIIRARVDTQFDTNPKFQEKCKTIFNNCPDLLAQMIQDFYPPPYLRILVAEFNQCLASKANK